MARKTKNQIRTELITKLTNAGVLTDVTTYKNLFLSGKSYPAVVIENAGTITGNDNIDFYGQAYKYTLYVLYSLDAESKDEKGTVFDTALETVEDEVSQKMQSIIEACDICQAIGDTTILKSYVEGDKRICGESVEIEIESEL